jgi:Na+-transporting methylmalonyl-CoA/oxaloacetate decarboxylase gamma subunit
MDPDTVAALQVTLVGMALVFLTLLICALVINILSRMFKPEPKEEEEEAPALPALDALGATASPASSDAADESAQAAAVAVAFALAARAVSLARNLSGTRLRPALAMRPTFSSVADEEIVGEVVTITPIDPGAGTWNAYGRIKATN